MKKIINLILLTIALLCFMTPSVKAGSSNIDEYAQEFDFQSVADSINDETAELLGELGIDEISFEKLFSVDITKVFDVLFDIAERSIQKPVEFLFGAVGVLILCSVAAAFLKDAQIINIIGGATLALFLTVPVAETITTVFSVLESLNIFTVSFAGAFCALVSSSGNVALGTSYASLAVLSDSLFTFLLSGISRPTVNAMCSLGFFSCFDVYEFCNRLSGMAKKLYIWFLGLTATFFSGIVTLRGVMSAGADSLTARGVRFVVGRAVPVVGGTVSDTYTALVSSLALIKNTVGVFGIITVVITVLPSLIEIIAWVVVLNIVVAVSELLDSRHSIGMLNIIKDAYTLLGATLVFSAVIFIVSVGVVIGVNK